MGTALPMIVRIAGLPADAVSPFFCTLCRDHLERLRTLEESSLQARTGLVDVLGGLIHGAPDAQRHFLLGLKRDCFNARDLSRYPDHPQWEGTAAEVRSQVDRILLLKGESEAARADFETAYLASRRGEIEHLLSFLGDTRFLRGVALSSTSLVDNLARLLGKPLESYGRRERRLLATLLRYVTRAALKLSPFSTLTGIGLGAISLEDAETENPHFALHGPGTWQERSKVRLQRSRVEQLASQLMLDPSFRARLRLAVNDTVEEVEADRYRLLRGAAWERDPEKASWRERRPALVTVRLRGAFIHWLLENAAVPSRTYGELLEDLQKALPGLPADSLRQTVDRLLEIGFLCLAWPWATSDFHPEKRLLEALEEIPEKEALAPLIQPLQGLLAAEEAYSRSDSPARHAAELRSLGRSVLGEGEDFLLHEDIFFTSDRADREVATLSRRQTQEILENLRPLSRLSNAEDLRFDFLSTLGVFATGSWPGREHVPFLDLYEKAHSLFEAFVQYTSQVEGTGEVAAFNPLQIDALDQLLQSRRQLVSGLPRCVIAEGDEGRLDRPALDRLLAEIPSPQGDVRDFCAFLQPLDDPGTEWVLNVLTEGIGRMSSRFTTTMDPSMQESVIESYLQRSAWTDNGQEIELVDLFYSGGNSANIHVPYTRRVFEWPGTWAGLPPERRLHLRDLRARFGPDRPPELVDREGRRILPVHLGSVQRAFMPDLVRFLALFGPAELRYRQPTLPPVKAEGVVEYARHRVGNVVYRRKTWDIETAALRATLSGLTDAAAFRHINRRRSAVSIPDRVFLAEPVAVPHTKPQYIDFTSPLLVEIFCSALQKEVSSLRLTEALPGPEGHVPAEKGRRRAVEIQFESHLLEGRP